MLKNGDDKAKKEEDEEKKKKTASNVRDMKTDINNDDKE